MPVRTKVVGRKNKRVVDEKAPNTTMGTRRSTKKTLKGKVSDFRAKAKPAQRKKAEPGARKRNPAVKPRSGGSRSKK